MAPRAQLLVLGPDGRARNHRAQYLPSPASRSRRPTFQVLTTPNAKQQPALDFIQQIQL